MAPFSRSEVVTDGRTEIFCGALRRFANVSSFLPKKAAYLDVPFSISACNGEEVKVKETNKLPVLTVCFRNIEAKFNLLE
jgi:hypothetical protein